MVQPSIIHMRTDVHVGEISCELGFHHFYLKSLFGYQVVLFTCTKMDFSRGRSPRQVVDPGQPGVGAESLLHAEISNLHESTHLAVSSWLRGCRPVR